MSGNVWLSRCRTLKGYNDDAHNQCFDCAGVFGAYIPFFNLILQVYRGAIPVKSVDDGHGWTDCDLFQIEKSSKLQLSFNMEDHNLLSTEHYSE